MDLLLDDLSVTMSDGSLRRDGALIDTLTELELGLLAYLVAQPGVEVSREELHEKVWGYASGVRSRAVDFTMSRLRKKVEPDPGKPRFLHTVRGAGYRFDPASRPQPSLPAPPPDAFIGRRADLDALCERFRTGARLVTVLGLGGVGKTRLLLEFLRLPREDAGDTVVVDLSAVTTRSGLLEAVSATLGLPAGSGEPSRQIGERLRQRQTLLVLDDVDSVVAEAAALAGDWLQQVGVRLLVSSRERLRVAGEFVHELRPLASDDAASLFLHRVEAVRGSLSGPEREAAARVATTLSGWPLALELAAARSRLAPPSVLLSLIDPLTVGQRQRDRPTRHRSISAVLADTAARLSGEETAVLRVLALFPHGATLPTLLANLPTTPVLDAVTDLADRALVRLTEQHGEVRVHLLGLIRDWTRSKTGDAEMWDGLAVRQLRWAADHATAVAAHIRAGLGWTPPLDAERATVRTIWEARRGPSADAVRLGVALLHWWVTRGSWLDLRELADAVLRDATLLADPVLLAEAQLVWANVARLTGGAAEARAVCEALVASEASDALRREAGFLLGASLRRLGDLERARAVLTPLATGQDLSAARAATVLSLICSSNLEPALAIAHARAAVDLAKALPAPAFLASTGVNLAVCLRQSGRLPEARDALAMSDDWLEASGSPRLGAVISHELAQVGLDSGDLAAGERYQLLELQQLRDAGDRAGAAWPLGNLGVVYIELERLEQAREHLEEALGEHIAAGSRTGEAASLANLGILALIEGDPEAARPLLERALDLATQAGLKRFLPSIQAFLQLADGTVPEVPEDGPPQDMRLLRRVIASVSRGA